MASLCDWVRVRSTTEDPVIRMHRYAPCVGYISMKTDQGQRMTQNPD